MDKIKIERNELLRVMGWKARYIHTAYSYSTGPTDPIGLEDATGKTEYAF